MTIVLVTYATPAFAPYQAINAITARRAGFDAVRALGPGDIEASFARDNAEVLAAHRGAGYWLWKPYIVARTLSELAAGDLLCYCDAAAHFVGPIAPVVELLERRSLDMLVAGEGFRESQYTKRDAFILMDCDRDRYVTTPQRFACFFLMRKNAVTERFCASYLAHALDPRILTDRPNEMGRPNYPGFVDHRHDQSIFSMLTKQIDLEVPPTRFVAEGLVPREGQVLSHTRTHVTPGRILQHLLARGAVRPENLRELERLRTSTLPP